MQVKKPLSGTRQKRCRNCRRLFEPDARSKGKQRYCSRQSCQEKRQRKNEGDWRKRNPECLQRQYEQTRHWYKVHPDYSRQRRANDPRLLRANREQTRRRMKKTRRNKAFDKSKVILAQLTAAKADRCYLARGHRWVHLRLTKASALSKVRFGRDNQKNVKRVVPALGQRQVYDLSAELLGKTPAGP